MFNKLKEKFKSPIEKFINRETITYLIAGILTTVVNYFVYFLFSKVIQIDFLIANIIAWIVAVVFAYIINDLWVFRSKRGSIGIEIVKVSKFFGARLCSLLIEEAGLLLFVNIMHFNDLLVKACLNVIVIVVNYFFSKLFIFNKNKS